MKHDAKQKIFHRIDLSYLENLVSDGKISTEISEKLLNYWGSRLREPEDPLFSSYFEYYLFFESVNSGMLTAFVFDATNSIVRHQYGIMANAIVDILETFACTTYGEK